MAPGQDRPPLILHHTTCAHDMNAVVTTSECAEPLDIRKMEGGEQPTPVLAEGAVEDHLFQRALEYGELLVVQFRDEQFRHRAKMDRDGLRDARGAGIRQRDYDTTG